MMPPAQFSLFQLLVLVAYKLDPSICLSNPRFQKSSVRRGLVSLIFKMRHLYENMRKVTQGIASYLLAFMGIGGLRWPTVPVPKSSIMSMQITKAITLARDDCARTSFTKDINGWDPVRAGQ